MSKLLPVLASLTRVGLLLLIIIFSVTKGPELHSQMLRSKVGSKVVMIRALNGRSGGSGFFVKGSKTGNTYILTNNHVCALSGTKDKLLNITLANGLTVKRKVLKNYSEHDLCLVESVGKVSGLEVADSNSIGSTVAIMGHPKLNPLTMSKGEYIGDRTISVVIGLNTTEAACSGRGGSLVGSIIKINNLIKTDSLKLYLPYDKVAKPTPFQGLFFIQNLCIKEYHAAQTTAYSRGGSSGSPIINFYGNIVGVLFAGNGSDPHESFFVPLIELKNFLKDI